MDGVRSCERMRWVEASTHFQRVCVRAHTYTHSHTHTSMTANPNTYPQARRHVEAFFLGQLIALEEAAMPELGVKAPSGAGGPGAAAADRANRQALADRVRSGSIV